ncbi:DUF6882 domain-containing protein [uncultured Tateyamaria sp.]|uniref:DUF6882 domain-containing protein n=1 Tax=uncultured Tateyamaria sp. TaxID=455651 RepID=UPI00262F22C5|nr:DUF6882 domain-containing protein [uncultured Tateyamaria sp.]
MFQFRKSFAGFGKPKSPPRMDRSDYDGDGMWRECLDCGTVHKIEESAQFRILIEQLCCEIGNSSDALYKEFRIGEPDGFWNVDPEKALFKFTQADGTTSFARYGVIGSYNQNTHSWLWGWGFPEDWMPQSVLRIAEQCHDHCATQGWTPGTERMLLVNAHEAWHLTKLAAHVAGLPMVYRAAVNETNYHYFAMERPVWSV